jgi:hypothetical protein
MSVLRTARLLACLLSLSACNRSDVDKASLDLAKSLTTSVSVAPPTHATNGAVRVFIDASRSMRGFAGCSDAPTAFNTTLDHVTSSLSVDSVVQFGERSKGRGDVFNVVPMGQTVRCPAFYDRLQNPDYALFKAALDDSSGATYLYFTDGVQSDWQGSNPGPSLGALEHWLKSGRAFAILAFRSQFSGQAWSEQAQRMIANINAAKRPFYLFVLAQSDSALDATVQKLPASLLTSARTIRFGQDAVNCKIVPGNVPKFRSSPAPPWSLVEHAKITAGKSLVSYQCDVRSEYPLAHVRPRVTLGYRTWGGQAFSGATTPIAGAALKVLPSTDSQGRSVTPLEGALPMDGTTRFGFYSVRIDGDPGMPRTWIDSLSVDSDAQPETFDRTYRFSWLVERLARANLAMRAPAVYGLTIQYR